MSLRERVLIALAAIAVAATVIIPVTHRLNTELFGAGTAQGTPLAAVPSDAAPSAAGPSAATPGPTRPPSPPPLVRIAWTAQASEHRGAIGRTFEYACPPNGEPGRIWGMDTYTDDSAVCTAAVHQGLITLETGGSVTIVMRAGLPAYRGGVANGVSSEPWEAWPGSYGFITP